MPIQHEENKAFSSWANQKDSYPQPYRDSRGGVGFTGEISGSEPIRICGEDREGENTSVDAERETSGGVVDQLIEAIVEQLADSENRTEALRQQLEKIKSIRQQIKPSQGMK
jgi:hypothetical protein